MVIENNSPVLFIVFNRPSSTQIVLEAIKLSKPSKLYIAIDAPRINNSDDEKNCKLVREIVSQIDWECKTEYRFAEENQGCGYGVYNAISWAFTNEEQLIILEDDCVPSTAFFQYCNELLERYKNDSRVWCISGNQYNEEKVTTPHSYFFTNYSHIWGWATWKRCWSSMDLSLSKYPLIVQQDLFSALFRTKHEAQFFQPIFYKLYNSKSAQPHTWDFQFMFHIVSNSGLSISPKKNLVSNIGYLGSHNQKKSEFHDRKVDDNYKITSHPDFILCDVNYDAYHFTNHWNSKPSVSKRIVNKTKRIFKIKE